MEFEYRPCGDGIYITGYSENDQICRVPNNIDGKVVTGIDKFAFSEHREMRKIYLPETVRYIGAHAFYNCRVLEAVNMTDGVVDIGDGAFKNCYDIAVIDIIRKRNDSRCLKGILSEVNNEVEVTLHYDDGDAKIIFPYYLYNYEENTPARIINQVTEGSGIRYRECVTGDDVNYAEYDRIFEDAMHIDVLDASWRVACLRLKYPYKLADKARDCYRKYLNDNRLAFTMRMIEQEKYDGLKDFLSMKLLDNDDLGKCIDMAREKSHMEGLGILLEYRKEEYGTRKKKFEF